VRIHETVPRKHFVNIHQILVVIDCVTIQKSLWAEREHRMIQSFWYYITSGGHVKSALKGRRPGSTDPHRI
jgi:hypothetical protein